MLQEQQEKAGPPHVQGQVGQQTLVSTASCG